MYILKSKYFKDVNLIPNGIVRSSVWRNFNQKLIFFTINILNFKYLKYRNLDKRFH